MISFPVLSGNLISWIIQVSVIALLGTALPMLFRIRHPRTQLAYCHAVLVVCILLPLIEPWQHPLVLTVRSTVAAASPLESGGSLPAMLGWIIAAGMLARLGWLAGGILQIRRFRSAAAPLSPTPDSISRARMLTHSDARFGISRRVDGPATVGYVDPIILLPESFPSLDHEAQLSIACHELLHVKRNDWLLTLIEEFVGSVFWFNPAIWWLLSQAKLSREQLVDSEVVALTSAPAPYVHALLAMAGAAKSGAAKGMKIVPAASFLTEGHLTRRIRALLTHRKVSVSRLFLSYVSIVCLLMVMGWAVMLGFPLMGDAVTIQHAQKQLIAAPWTRAFAVTETKPILPAFNLHVIPPKVPPENIMFYRSSVDSGAESSEVTMPLPAGILPAPGVRVFRLEGPGALAGIAGFQGFLGNPAFAGNVYRDGGDGTFQRIVLFERRFPDETNWVPFNVIFGAVGAGPTSLAVPTEPAGGPDGIH